MRLVDALALDHEAGALARTAEHQRARQRQLDRARVAAQELEDPARLAHGSLRPAFPRAPSDSTPSDETPSNSAPPMRTTCAPARTASSKSALMPIERRTRPPAKAAAGRVRARRLACSKTSRAWRRAASGSLESGAMTISPSSGSGPFRARSI